MDWNETFITESPSMCEITNYRTLEDLYKIIKARLIREHAESIEQKAQEWLQENAAMYRGDNASYCMINAFIAGSKVVTLEW